jgi:type II secretory ATPase GspE/PulE/Tfp pilus assembly ATPase PilB-like protein
VRLVLAQRLARRLCPYCAEAETPTGEVARQIDDFHRRAPQLFDGAPKWRRPKGCHECFRLGFKGRLGLYEMVSVNPEIHDAILRRGAAQEMRDIARRQGMRTLREDGIAKAWHADTSLDEVFRVTGGTVGL